MAPIFRCWFAFAIQDKSGWRFPVDTSTVKVAGADTARILIIGDAPAAGYAVHTHQLGIAGHLARRLSDIVGRGVSVAVKAHPKASVRSTLETIGGVDIGKYDAIVVMLTTTDGLSLTRRSSLARRMSQLVRAIMDAHGSPPFVTSTADLSAITSLDPLIRRVAGYHARIINHEVKRVCVSTDAHHIQLATASEFSSATYRAWAMTIAGAVAPRLPRLRRRLLVTRNTALTTPARRLVVAA